METAFTRLVGCTVPIQQAGMGGAATPALVIAVAEAGALGMLGLPGVPPAVVTQALDTVEAGTKGAYGVNFLMPFLDRSSVETAAARARVVEFFYGRPDQSLVSLGHEGGALVSWQVGSVEEARAAADAGCDLIVAQGVEAGGHVRGEIGLLPLLDGVLAAVAVPVLAAGGIGSARAVAAVLAAGASGARVGTRFVAAEEADAHPDYVDALIAADAGDTILTTTFSLMWPDAPHRVLRSSVEAADKLTDDVVGETQLSPDRTVPVPRLSPSPPTRGTTGRIEAMALYAGESVGSVTKRMKAADIVNELAAGAGARTG